MALVGVAAVFGVAVANVASVAAAAPLAPPFAHSIRSTLLKRASAPWHLCNVKMFAEMGALGNKIRNAPVPTGVSKPIAYSDPPEEILGLADAPAAVGNLSPEQLRAEAARRYSAVPLDRYPGLHYDIKGASRGRIDRYFDTASETFMTPEIVGQDSLQSAWLAVDIAIPQPMATIPIEMLRPARPLPRQHSADHRYNAVILRSSRTGAVVWTVPAGSPTFKVLAGITEATILQQMRDADSHMLLLGVWITKTFDPKWSNGDIYEESRAAGVPMITLADGKEVIERQLIWSAGEGWTHPAWADWFSTLVSTPARATTAWNPTGTNIHRCSCRSSTSSCGGNPRTANRTT